MNNSPINALSTRLAMCCAVGTPTVGSRRRPGDKPTRSFVRWKVAILAAAIFAALPLSSRAAAPGKSQQLTSPDQVPDGIVKSEWASIRAAYEAGRHAFQPVAGGWQARNPGQQWLTTFDRHGFVAQPSHGSTRSNNLSLVTCSLFRAECQIGRMASWL